ncbi:hypothetical protein GGX14DRAFT_445696, partial [Mycena pura]
PTMPLSANGFEAWITIDDHEAQPFQPETVDEPSGQTCWIASELDKGFSIHCKNTDVSCQAVSRIGLDGIECPGEILLGPNREAKVSGRRTTATAVHPFIFSRVNMTDDDAFLDSTAHTDVGHIRVEIWTINVTGNKLYPEDVAPPMESKVHERSKKGVAHQIKFGEPVVGNSRSAATYDYLETFPLVTFVFKYRSIDILRANGLAPPLVAGKRKAHDDSVKQEDKGPKRLKKESRQPGEIIDLTRSETLVTAEVIDL